VAVGASIWVDAVTQRGISHTSNRRSNPTNPNVFKLAAFSVPTQTLVDSVSAIVQIVGIELKRACPAAPNAWTASRRLATGGGDKQVFLWDVASGQKIRRFRGHESAVNAVQFAGRALLCLNLSTSCAVLRDVVRLRMSCTVN